MSRPTPSSAFGRTDARNHPFYARNLPNCLERLSRIRALVQVLDEGDGWLEMKSNKVRYRINIAPVSNMSLVEIVPKNDGRTPMHFVEWDELERVVRSKKIGSLFREVRELDELIKRKGGIENIVDADLEEFVERDIRREIRQDRFYAPFFQL